MLDRGVIIPINKGEFILPSKLAPENAGAGLPSLIPPGMRAVSVRVNEVVSVAGFVGPGTRVDVLLTGTPNGSSESQTTTVLQNVAVIAAGHTLERNANGEAQNTPVITLLASPEDAERVTLASSEGKIQLVLRNPFDTHEDSVDAANARGLYKGGTPPPAPTRAAVHPVKHKARATNSSSFSGRRRGLSRRQETGSSKVAGAGWRRTNQIVDEARPQVLRMRPTEIFLTWRGIIR